MFSLKSQNNVRLLPCVTGTCLICNRAEVEFEDKFIVFNLDIWLQMVLVSNLHRFCCCSSSLQVQLTLLFLLFHRSCWWKINELTLDFSISKKIFGGNLLNLYLLRNHHHLLAFCWDSILQSLKLFQYFNTSIVKQLSHFLKISHLTNLSISLIDLICQSLDLSLMIIIHFLNLAIISFPQYYDFFLSSRIEILLYLFKFFLKLFIELFLHFFQHI